MNTPRRPEPASVRTHPFLGLLISLLPGSFRQRYGQDVADAADGQSRDPRYGRGPLGRVRFWADVTLDLVATAVRLHMRRMRARAQPSTVLFSHMPSPAGSAAGASGPGRTPPLGGDMRAPDPLNTANEQFKRRAHAHVWWGLIAATAVHFAVLAYFPEFTTGVDWTPTETPPPHVVNPHIPPPEPPTDIPRPRAPRITVADVDTDVTIAGLDQMWQSAPDLPPPPPTAEEATTTNAVWLGPSMTPPHLKNPDEVSRTLEREYPAILRDAGIGGTAVLVLLVDDQGRVVDARVETSSGHNSLDGAAVSVALMMDFTPALNRDKPLAVWVRIPVSFEVKRGGMMLERLAFR